MHYHIELGGDDVEEVVIRPLDHDRERSPESGREITSMRRVVWGVAKQLPERQRMVLTLRELQGLSSASIAHVMGISQSAVETLLHRARRRFKELFLRQEGTTEASGDCATAPQSSRTAGDATSARDG